LVEESLALSGGRQATGISIYRAGKDLREVEAE